uniref:Neur_chan_memb domain-containing protein n=1 Tax=Steinernema glaseri TaxID=37863 RepID=A0A1I7ZTD3_9BILA
MNSTIEGPIAMSHIFREPCTFDATTLIKNSPWPWLTEMVCLLIVMLITIVSLWFKPSKYSSRFSSAKVLEPEVSAYMTTASRA